MPLTNIDEYLIGKLDTAQLMNDDLLVAKLDEIILRFKLMYSNVESNELPHLA